MCNRADRFRVGERVALPGLTVEIEKLDSHGDPAQAIYRFSTPLDAPALRWMRWSHGKYVPWTPPALGRVENFAATQGIF